jgi:hypothetical protein
MRAGAHSAGLVDSSGPFGGPVTPVPERRQGGASGLNLIGVSPATLASARTEVDAVRSLDDNHGQNDDGTSTMVKVPYPPSISSLG